jgi:hypothetical protein
MSLKQRSYQTGDLPSLEIGVARRGGEEGCVQNLRRTAVCKLIPRCDLRHGEKVSTRNGSFSKPSLEKRRNTSNDLHSIYRGIKQSLHKHGTGI